MQELAFGVERVVAHGHATQPERGVVRDHELGAVGQDQPHAVALANPERGEHPAELLDLLEQAFVGHGLSHRGAREPERDGGSRWVPAGGFLQERIQGYLGKRLERLWNARRVAGQPGSIGHRILLGPVQSAIMSDAQAWSGGRWSFHGRATSSWAETRIRTSSRPSIPTRQGRRRRRPAGRPTAARRRSSAAAPRPRAARWR